MSAATTPGPREAAVALVALGPERAATILRSLGEPQARRLAAEVAALGPVDPNEVRTSLTTLVRSLGSPQVLPAPGPRMARDLLVRALGPEAGAAASEGLDVPAPFAWLEDADPEAAGRALASEPAGVVALALAHLSPRAAARLLTRLPAQAQAPVATRIAALGAVHPETVKHVDTALRSRVAELLKTEVRRVDGPELLAGLLAKTPSEASRELLQAVAAVDPELAAATRDRLFTFEDLCALEARTLQVVLRAVDGKQLAVALRNLPQEIVDTVLANLSERARESLVEEMDLLGNVKATDIQAARAAAVAAARQLEDEGSVGLAREADE
jgi:flagellar motor switch protein FliG